MPKSLGYRAIRKIRTRSPLFAFEDLKSSPASHSVGRRQVGDKKVILIPEGGIGDSFIRQLNSQRASDFETVTLDLSKLVRIDGRVIARFLLASSFLRKQNRVFRPRGCSDSMFKMFAMIKLIDLLSIQR